MTIEAEEDLPLPSHDSLSVHSVEFSSIKFRACIPRLLIIVVGIPQNVNISKRCIIVHFNAVMLISLQSSIP